MNIALLVNYFPPEIGSAADVFYLLACEFQKKGHVVNVFTTEPRSYNISGSSVGECSLKVFSERIDTLWSIKNIMPNLTVYRIRLLPLIYPKSGKNAFFKELEHVLQPLLFMATINQLALADVLLVYSPPLTLGWLGSIIGKFLNISTVVNVQDIHPTAIIDLGLLSNPALIYMFEVMERQMYKYADVITVHSQGNKDIVVNHGVNPRKIFVVFNPCSIPSTLLLGEGKDFRKKHSLENKFVITYAGIMSFSQDLETIIISAKLLSNKLKNSVFIMAGDGPRREALIHFSRKLDVRNVLFLPFQRGDDYWRLLAASDVCIVPLKKSKVKTPVVPRKLQDIMAAGRPVIANVPLDGDVKKIIEEADCGMVVEAENPERMANMIQKIYDMPEEARLLYGRNGRQYAVRNFTPQAIAAQYETLFRGLVGNMT